MHDSGLVPSHQSMKKFAMDAWIRDLSLKYKFWAVNLVAFVTTWIVVNLFANNIMQVLFIRWRFRGGRLLGSWTP